MKKFLFSFIFLFICFFLFSPSSVNALTVAEIGGTNYCGNNSYTLGEAMSDGSFRFISCHYSYGESLAAMTSNPLDNLTILIRQSDYTSIYDAKYALVDLTANGTKSGITDYMADDTTAQGSSNPPVVGYMNHEPAYGSVDGAYLSLFEKYRSARVIVNNFKGYITYSGYYNGEWDNDYQIVPLAWVKSASYYAVTADAIVHCSTRSILAANPSPSCRTLGPKPSNLNVGTYYSYDGKYFYYDLKTMLSDYKGNHYNNSVNAGSPYYNYYMYLPHRSKTTYSSVNINDYFRASYTGTVPGAPSVSSNIVSNTSLLYGTGNYFYSSQEIYGTNAMLMLAVSRNETGNGRSRIATSKNNGFGHNAVDSDPAVAASKYANFASSIYAHAYAWIGSYSDPDDWRFFGSSVGNKGVGMNIKYASDPYWGEKAAMYYHSFDKYYGYSDYNFYQLGVTKYFTEAKASPSSSSKTVYNYKQHDMSVIIVEDVNVNGELWYKVTSEVSLDANKNMRPTTSEFDWENSYVYVKANDILKVNVAKEGYKDPATDAYAHADADYRYYFYTESGKEAPKTATLKSNTTYYYDAALISNSNKTVLNGKIVMVYAEVRDASNNVVSYLVTSDHMSDQQLWVGADKIAFISHDYGYRWLESTYLYEEVYVSPTRSSTEIGRNYNDSFTPIMETKNVGGSVWYKIPFSMDGSSYEYGWVMGTVGSISTMTYYVGQGADNLPKLTVTDLVLVEGKTFDPMVGVSASDLENGDLSSIIQVESNSVNINVPGTYEVIYSVTDYDKNKVTATRIITVIEDEEPVITATDLNILINSSFDPMIGVSASDNEDASIALNVITNTVDVTKTGTYKVIYSVTDSFGHTVTKEIKVIVNDKEERESFFYLDYIKDVNGNLQVKGYSTIQGIDNNLATNISYKIIYENIEDDSLTYEQSIDRITNTSLMTRPIFSLDGKDYTYSWFTGNIDLTLLEEGNYRMYIVAEAPSYYSKNYVSNKLYMDQDTSFVGDKSVFIRNDFDDKNGPILLYVRDETLALKDTSAMYNQFDTYRTIEFTEDGLLRLMGHTASFGLDLSSSAIVERTIVFENKSTYETYKFDIGSTDGGLYNVILPVNDGFNKNRAWYDASIDVSNIPKGEYVIYLTTSSNLTDIAEITEKLNRNEELENISYDIDEKTYSFSVNMSFGNRIEMIVK